MGRRNVLEYLGEYPNANRLKLIMDCIEGLRYLHSMGLMHGDLRGVNTLVDREGHAELGDFGLTRTAYDSNLLILSHVLSETSIVGTWRWMAPGIL
ncbi:kinase-like protein [Neolentinus lepideus HHB14362 ss-1]|uniref:Kinase-like protein n=1 Tax=Neolentinus lepideus HHB14362 ss-1 TaxID=1314782 RepID=A0A165RS70_9AGAM|nr:kinase-like protein [Neolentinus lepideus HHB14362 ss-1]